MWIAESHPAGLKEQTGDKCFNLIVLTVAYTHTITIRVLHAWLLDSGKYIFNVLINNSQDEKRSIGMLILYNVFTTAESWSSNTHSHNINLCHYNYK